MGKVLLKAEIPGKELFWRGKVRDTYIIGEDLLLMVATDRISAFDVVLPNAIPDKGRVLNQLSGFWFEKTRHIVPNHLVQMVESINLLRPYFDPSVSDVDLSFLVGHSMIIRKAKRIDIECVVRGYLAGSALADYRKTGMVFGQVLREGLREGDRLPWPVFTPTTKATTGHDQPLSLSEMEEMVGQELTDEMMDASLEIYKFANDYARQRGIIIADTKMEFGLIDGELTLIDELLTSDSSRFWDAATYKPGGSQPSFDKQPLRDWLKASGWNKQPPAPPLPDEIVEGTKERYIEAYERLVGKIWPPKF